MMRLAVRATILVVRPGTAFDSCTQVEMPSFAPIFSAGKLA